MDNSGDNTKNDILIEAMTESKFALEKTQPLLTQYLGDLKKFSGTMDKSTIEERKNRIIDTQIYLGLNSKILETNIRELDKVKDYSEYDFLLDLLRELSFHDLVRAYFESRTNGGIVDYEDVIPCSDIAEIENVGEIIENHINQNT